MIEIPATKQPNKRGSLPVYIVREIDKDMVINLKEWFIQFLPPEDGDENGPWRLSLQPRKEMRDRVMRDAANLPENDR